MSDTRANDSYSEAEMAKRVEEPLKRMLATPPKPHKDSKVVGKRERDAAKN